jgi:hypothetical protein
MHLRSRTPIRVQGAKLPAIKLRIDMNAFLYLPRSAWFRGVMSCTISKVSAQIPTTKLQYQSQASLFGPKGTIAVQPFGQPGGEGPNHSSKVPASRKNFCTWSALKLSIVMSVNGSASLSSTAKGRMCKTGFAASRNFWLSVNALIFWRSPRNSKIGNNSPGNLEK